MKKLFSAIILASVTMLCAHANRVDSVWIKPDIKDGAQHLQIAYSHDKKHWTHVNYTIFSSDYGAWGSEKKMWYPNIIFDGKQFKAYFIPNLKAKEVGHTKSDDMVLWKPQDYEYVDNQETFDKIVANAKEDCQKPIRVPYSYIEKLITRKRVADQNASWESENYVRTGTALVKEVKDVKVDMKIDWDDTKAISPNLMGIFFEDISYAADGGLYAELVQNRDFEYSAADHRGWDSKTSWKVEGDASLDISTTNPIHANNAHYAVFETKSLGAKLVNEGWDGIAVKAKAKYNLSLFLRGEGRVKVSLVNGDKQLAAVVVSASNEWKQKKAVLVATADAAKASLVLEPLQQGTLDLDFISLFPQNTYKGRANGLRKDLAEVIADLKPRFVRFPGGCASHGNGINNIYHWQATIGNLWERQGDYNIWNYHQTRGLGFYEYFQFCEDIGAEPVPVLSAGVPCQNSSRGGAEGYRQNGQQGGIPFLKDLEGKPSPYKYMGKDLTMESYLQELLDLIEWANGDAKKSPLAAMRAKAGHPKPFNLKYLGIGNEDLLGDTFFDRYEFLSKGIKEKHPEITVIGTVGPFWEGSDYEYGWRGAKENNVEIVDEHYYNTPGWYFHHRDFYDNYDRNGTKVYLGEWASKGNHVSNALIEAAYLTHLEENADVVVMSSYAPLLAKDGHYSWTPDMIFFNNTEIRPAANYYVQRAFGQNGGDTYVYSSVKADYTPIVEAKDRNGRPLPKKSIQAIENRIDKSVVIDSKTGDVIIKLVSLLPEDAAVNIALGKSFPKANMTVLKSGYDAISGMQSPDAIKEWESIDTNKIKADNNLSVELPAYSMAIIRLGK